MMSLFVLGIFIGVVMEVLTGMGTAFGLGMYLPLQYTLMMLTGGAARDLWEKHYLNRRAKAQKWSENESDLDSPSRKGSAVAQDSRLLTSLW